MPQRVTTLAVEAITPVSSAPRVTAFAVESIESFSAPPPPVVGGSAQPVMFVICSG